MPPPRSPSRAGLHAWWSDVPGALPGRLPPDAPGVPEAISGIVPESATVDLGGNFSLNLHLTSAGLVLRVHQPFVSRRRLLDLQAVRRHLPGAGATVPLPLAHRGRTVFRVAGRWAELEPHVPHVAPAVDVHRAAQLFGDLGVHGRRLASCTVRVTRPVVATWATPTTLRRWLDVSRAAVGTDREAAALVRRARGLVRDVTRGWVPLSELPQQIVHGDGKPNNLPRLHDGRPLVLDLGFTALRPRVHELTYSLNWAMSALGEEAVCEHADGWIGAFEEGLGSRLSVCERSAMPALGAAVALHRTSVAGFTPDPARDLLNHRAGIERADWWLGTRERWARA